MSAGDFLIGLFHQKLIPDLRSLPGSKRICGGGGTGTGGLQRLARCCKSVHLKMSDTTGFDHAQVCAGGIPLAEINSHTMESTVRNGLYLAGEMLDADGECGGYNLQWAWSSGYLAGLHAAQL